MTWQFLAIGYLRLQINLGLGTSESIHISRQASQRTGETQILIRTS